MPADPCPECGCDPSDPWGCGCGNEDCPCSEDEDDGDIDAYPLPQGEQALRDIGY